MEKGGFSHIEIVLAFVIFIGALIFALYFFSPLHNDLIVDSSLSYTLNAVKKNISVELTTFSVVLDNSVIRNDGRGSPKNIGIEIDNPYNREVRVERYTGEVISSAKMSWNNEKSIIGLEWNDNGENKDFIVVKVSEDFSHGDLSGSAQNNVQYYHIGSVSTSEVISEKRALNLNRSYYSDYSGLKNSFNLNRVDFGFSLSLSQGEDINAQQSKPARQEVFSDNKRLETLRSSGKMEFGDLSAYVW